MCRLFGMSGGDHPVSATFWLLEAPDSLARQSRREPDGTGLGWFGADGRPQRLQAAAGGLRGPGVRAPRRASSSRPSFLAHIRYATTGGLDVANTHPFEQRGRLFAHNGVILELERLERELGDDRSLVTGDTDSERLFALVTREIERHGGDVGAGIAAAARWVAAELPLYAINMILGTPDGLWALRYPDTHELWVLERGAGGPGGDRHLDAASAAGTVRVRSEPLVAPPVGDRRQRADGRGPGLAAARARRADPRRPGAAGRVVDRPRPPAGPPADPRRPRPDRGRRPGAAAWAQTES